MYGETIGSLTVYLSNDKGRQRIWELKGNQGNKWMKAAIPIANESPFKVNAHAYKSYTDYVL